MKSKAMRTILPLHKCPSCLLYVRVGAPSVGMGPNETPFVQTSKVELRNPMEDTHVSSVVLR